MNTEVSRDPRSRLLGRFIREQRELCGVTREELAREVGCAKASIDVLERGVCGLPGPALLYRLAQALQIGWLDLLLVAYAGQDEDGES